MSKPILSDDPLAEIEAYIKNHGPRIPKHNYRDGGFKYKQLQRFIWCVAEIRRLRIERDEAMGDRDTFEAQLESYQEY